MDPPEIVRSSDLKGVFLYHFFKVPSEFITTVNTAQNIRTLKDPYSLNQFLTPGDFLTDSAIRNACQVDRDNTNVIAPPYSLENRNAIREYLNRANAFKWKCFFDIVGGSDPNIVSGSIEDGVPQEEMIRTYLLAGRKKGLVKQSNYAKYLFENKFEPTADFDAFFQKALLAGFHFTDAYREQVDNYLLKTARYGGLDHVAMAKLGALMAATHQTIAVLHSNNVAVSNKIGLSQQSNELSIKQGIGLKEGIELTVTDMADYLQSTVRKYIASSDPLFGHLRTLNTKALLA